MTRVTQGTYLFTIVCVIYVTLPSLYYVKDFRVKNHQQRKNLLNKYHNNEKSFFFLFRRAQILFFVFESSIDVKSVH